jgi:glycosyltransferase involved in cell wall biosynthesis
VRILFVSSYPASPAAYGGQRRLEGLMSALARRHEMSAAALANSRFDIAESEREMRRYCTDVFLVRSRSEGGGKRLLQLRAILSRRSFESHSFAVPEFQQTLDAALTKKAVDVVIVSGALGMSGYRLQQAPPGNRAPRVVLDNHNIEFDLQRQMSGAGSVMRRLHYTINWRKVRREELEEWGSRDGVTFTSVPDRDRALSRIPSLRAAVVPNGVDLSAFQPGEADPPPDGVTVMFFGINDYYPNTDGILFLLREIWPRIASSHPRARLKIVGPQPTPEILAHRSDRIEVTGRADDLREQIASAAVMVVPLRLGGGTRLKVLEAMAMGKPVVSTVIGAEGIAAVHGEHLLLADEPEQFAAAVGRFLDDPDLGARLGRQGRALVAERYSWGAAADEMERFLSELVTAS